MNSGPYLSAAIRCHAAARPAALAVRDEAGDRSFAELARAVDVVTAALQVSGVAPGDRVAVLAAPSGEAIALLAGILAAGAIAVPLGTRLARPEIAAALEETRPTLIVPEPTLAALADGHGPPVVTPAELAARAHGSGPREVDLDPAAPAVGVLTSGTSGRAKAALLSHGALAASAEAWLAMLPPAGGWLLCLGLAHVAGLGVVWRALGGGVPLRILPAFEPAAVLDALRGADAPSHVSLVPVQLARLLAAAGMSPPPALRAVLVGGGPIRPDLVARAIAGGWPIVVSYGLTEAGSGVTALPADEAGAAAGSAGRPLPGVRIRIARPAADGVGEVEVRSPAAFGGYLGRPDATAAAFTPDGWLRTGDLGRLDASGRLVIADRRDDLVVSGGENVYPAEVEAVLAAHPAVAGAVVAGRPDPAWGAVPVAGVVLRLGAADPGDDALRAWCRDRLAAYKVPVAFVRLAALPCTVSGKLRRGALRDRLGPLVVLLHATLSTGRQLGPLARALAEPGDLRVLAPDRRGSGTRRLGEPRPVAMAEHLADLAALLDAEGAGRAVLVGHSFGGVVALEAAARLPERIEAVVAYEPPYMAVADEGLRRGFEALARATAGAFAAGGAPAAARAFVGGVAGPAAWEAMPARSRAFLASQGAGAVADAALTGLDPDGLGRIVCPVVILAGTASEPFYAPIADALVERIPGSRRVDLAGLRHVAPITDPLPVAAAVRAALASAGLALAGARPPRATGRSGEEARG